MRAIASVDHDGAPPPGDGDQHPADRHEEVDSTQVLIASRVSKKVTFSHSISPDQNAEVETSSRSG